MKMSSPEDFAVSDPIADSRAALRFSAARLREWLARTALPVWAERAQRPSGDWVEHLHPDGTPDMEAERRWRINARQAVAYAQADMAGWFDGADIARRSFDAYWSQGWTGRHVVHRIRPDGTVSDARADLYDHAFALLACARMMKLTGQASYREKADLITGVLDHMAHQAGGWSEGDVKPQPRRQNPHMHLLEASLALFEASGNRADLSIAHEVMTLFERHFLCGETICEFFAKDWAHLPNDSDTIEPGHAAEWIWLLRHFDNATGTDHRAAMHTLYDRAFRSRLGRLFDEERRDGDFVRQTTRLWVQCEAIKAHLAMTETGAPGAAEMAAASIDAMFGTFLLPDGLWADQLNACDANVAKTVPVSTLYHIVAMAVEAERVGRASVSLSS